MKSVVYTLSNGRKLDRKSFLRYFEKKVLYTIRKYNLINLKDKVAIACSGGKDSLTLTYLLFEFCKTRKQKFVALAIDEGISGYRNKLLEITKNFCSRNKIPFKIFYFKKEFGFSLGDKKIQSRIKKLGISNCYVCSVLKRWLLNKKAKELKCSVMATAHSLDDEAENIMLNLFKSNTELLAKLGPKTGILKIKDFVQRVKPFYLCSTKEIVLYANLKNLPIPKDSGICPLRGITFRVEIRKWLAQMNKKHIEMNNAIINSFLKMMPILKEKFAKQGKITRCKKCGSVSSQKECKTCQILNQLK